MGRRKLGAGVVDDETPERSTEASTYPEEKEHGNHPDPHGQPPPDALRSDPEGEAQQHGYGKPDKPEA